MSNFGQSSLGNTKVGACREHEDSGRGKCFMPGLIRPDRNYKEASPSKEKDEEGRERERGGKERKEKKLTGRGSGTLECCMILKHTCQNLLMRPSEPAPRFNFNIQPPGKRNTSVMRSQIKKLDPSSETSTLGVLNCHRA